ncbi:S8 family serine peptidase [Cohnella silvisoli]|uniref:S8 family serine peptidase n=1 Tax=Cohnella silvisoli TaxID=2873699 RepID=A0ABV1KPQ4_9BACL|nr:S8 family serine peptidase [Cohnella silvisoli]MCD9022265.1 S8 family serine peptidase [Cohnella silvisoli]
MFTKHYLVTISTIVFATALLAPARLAQAAESSPAAQFAPANSPAPAFLKTLGIPEAWSLLSNDVTSTIAIVDTGVDLNNPEIKPYLLEGKNLVNDRKSPQDDNGHGTAVAGIIAAVAKAGESSSGTGRWKGRFLPIKALDQYGSGDEEKLTQGIRYAIEQGADIIVLSLGLRRDAPNLRDAVAFAESKGVLLIAASGNDAAVFGPRAAVQYPAAYPTVIAVAGSEGGKPVSQSTPGPEIDLSAAWRVQTLALGGGVVEMEGTSMGAPQVAAVAAMLKAEHPDWKPIRLREALRRTAISTGTDVWNVNAGYGLVSANKAIQADSTVDWREPNDTRAKAAEFPLGKEVSGTWGSLGDNDWFTFEVPYDGIYSLSGDEARFTLYSKDGLVEPRSVSTARVGFLKQWPVKKGRYWLQSLSSGATASDPDGYRFVSQFMMSPDAREPNDSAASAFTLPARTQQWIGSFHRLGDLDWVVVTLPKPGLLRLTVSTDTSRIDPEILVQPAGGSVIIVDERGDGGTEQWVLKYAKAGKYYFRIANAVSAKPEAVIGTYAATLEYITEKEDPYEPNDGPLTSTPLSPDKVYNGLINTNKDEDWYRFTLTKTRKVKLSVGYIPDSMRLNVELRNKKLQTLKKWSNGEGRKTLLGEKILLPGTYYVAITADRYNRNQTYGLRMLLTDS